MVDSTPVWHEKMRLREFDLLKPNKSSRISLRCATVNDVEVVCNMVRHEIPGEVAAAAIVRKAIAHNRNNVLLFCRGKRVVGVWALLMLNALGLEKLLLGELDTLNPSTALLATRMSTPAAIYTWAVVAPGIAIEGVFHLSRFLNQPIYRHANLFTRPVTLEGIRLILGIGFKPIGCPTPGLHRYERLANRAMRLPQAA